MIRRGYLPRYTNRNFLLPKAVITPYILQIAGPAKNSILAVVIPFPVDIRHLTGSLFHMTVPKGQRPVWRQIHTGRFHYNLPGPFVVDTSEDTGCIHAGCIHRKIQVKGRIVASVYIAIYPVLPVSFRQQHFNSTLLYLRFSIEGGRFGFRRL